MPSDHRDVRDFSRVIFGARYRLEVADAIARQGGVFFTKELAGELGLDTNLVHLEIRKLEEAGLVRRLPKVPGQQQVYLERLPSPYWSGAQELFRELEGRSKPAPTSPERGFGG